MKEIYALVALTLIYSFNYFDRLLMSLLMPLMKNDIKLTDTQFGLLSGVFFVVIYATAGIPISRLADRGNRKTILSIGFLFWSIVTALTGFVHSFWQLAVTRFLMGVGEATGTPVSSSLIPDLFDVKKRPLAFSIMISGTSISSLLLTPLAGHIAQVYGWRQVYWLSGVTGFLLALVILLTVREPIRGRFEAPVDTNDKRKTFAESTSFLLKSRSYIYICISASLFIISFYGYIVWGTTFLVRVHHLDVAYIAKVFGPIGGICGLAGGLLSGPIMSQLTRRDERWAIWLPCLCISVYGVSQYVYIAASSLYVIFATSAVSIFSVTMLVPLISVLLTRIIPVEIRTFGMATYFLINSLLGDMIGPLAVGYLNDRFSSAFGSEAIRYSLAITALLSLLSVPVFLLAGRYLGKDIESSTRWSRSESVPA